MLSLLLFFVVAGCGGVDVGGGTAAGVDVVLADRDAAVVVGVVV